MPCGKPPPVVPLIEWPDVLHADGTFHVSVETTRELFLLIGLAADYFHEQRVCHAASQEAPSSQPASLPTR